MPLKDSIVDFVKTFKSTDKNLGQLGGFASLIKIPKDEPYDRVALSCDGLGSKVLITQGADEDSEYHAVMGIDVVAANINDIIAQGCTPISFMAYFSSSHQCPKWPSFQQVMAGIAEGCSDSGCKLVGGETATLKHHHVEDSTYYDVVGFAMGVGLNSTLRSRNSINEGDIIFGINSNGFHNNGYTKIIDFFDKMDFEEDLNGLRVVDVLLKPTRIYYNDMYSLQAYITSAAHITGGGLLRNIPRMLPEGSDLTLEVDLNSWDWCAMPDFPWYHRVSGMKSTDMLREFNCGIGMAFIVDEDLADKVNSITGDDIRPIGRVTKSADKKLHPLHPIRFLNHKIVDEKLADS